MNFKEISDLLRKMADACDTLANLEERKDAGEDVSIEYERCLGSYMVAAMKLQ